MKKHKMSQEKYDKLTDKQRKFFDSYVKTRSLSAVVKDTGFDTRDAYGVYASKGVQDALFEYNENMKEYSLYNEAIIIDKLWMEYMDPETPKAIKVNILVHLGKHIGMWANQNKNQDKAEAKTVYNIVNYNSVKEEIDKNKAAVEKEKDKIEEQNLEIPDGVQIMDYSGHA